METGTRLRSGVYGLAMGLPVARLARAVLAVSLLAVLSPLVAINAAGAQQTCLGRAVTVQIALGQVPTLGDDVILGTEGDDVIAASDGNDVVCGLGGNDAIWGQGGDDAIDGGEGDDRIRGGAGNDYLRGRSGVDDLSGGRGNDDVDAGSGPDAKVRGGTGDDVVTGGSGSDVLIAGNGGVDQVDGGLGNDALVSGGPRPDVVRGGDGNDLIKGNGGADQLFGEGGDDDVRGGPQPDVIDGGPGTDSCSGGTTGDGAPEADVGRNCESYIFVESVETAVASGSFLLTAASGDVVAPDSLGPAVMMAQIDGSAATWATAENADGSISFQNELTGQWLGVRDGAVLLVNADERGFWQPTSVGADTFTLSIDGLFLRATGVAVGLTAAQADATVWSLPVAPEASSASMITNVASGLSLTGTSAEDRSIVRVGPGAGLARGYWLIEDVVASTEPCAPAGGVIRCVVIINNELGEVLDADRSNSSTPVKTTSLVGADSLWEIDDLGAGEFTLKNVERGEFLTQAGPRAVATDLLLSADAAWTTASVVLDAAGCPETDAVVSITSHAAGEVVDMTMDGSGTGSFQLSGTAPAGTTAVNVSLGGMVTGANLDVGACSVSWSVEASPLDGGSSQFTVDALAGAAVTASAGIALSTVTADVNEPLLTPEAAASPNLEPLLISYDPTTGLMVFSGEVNDELRSGDVLAGEPSAIAPDGYLRAVLDVSFDGTNTIVTTRQAALTEYVRQLNVVYQGALEDNPAFDVVAPFDPAVDGTITEAGPGGAVIAVGNASSRSVSGRQAEEEPFRPDGALDFQIDPDLDIDIDIDWERNCWYCLPVPTLKRFLTEASVEMDVKASFEFTESLGVDTGLVYFGPELDDYKLGVITLPTPIPIVITIELDMQAFYTAELNAIFKAEFQWSAEAIAGFEYKDVGGRGAYSDLIVPSSPVPSVDVDLGINGSAALGVEVELEAKLYGTAGVEFQVRPRILTEVTADIVDREIKFEGKFTMPISSGIEIDLIVKELEFGEIEFITIEYELWQYIWTLEEEDVSIVDPEWGDVSARSLFGHTFEAIGEGPFEWEGIRIPAGFTFSDAGVLRGSPGTAGDYTFEIKVTAANGATASNQFVLHVVETEVGSGRLQFTLRWDNDNDMDLHVYEPDGTHIWYNATGPTATGGQLDRDDNVGQCGSDPVPGGVENIFWPSETGAPTGVYRIGIVEFNRCPGASASSWTLEAFSESALVLSRSGVGPDELTFSYFGAGIPLAG